MELDSHEELDDHWRVQAGKIKRREVVLGPASRVPRRDLEQGGGAGLQLLLNSCSTDIVCVTLLRTAQLKQQLAEYISCFALARFPPP